MTLGTLFAVQQLTEDPAPQAAPAISAPTAVPDAPASPAPLVLEEPVTVTDVAAAVVPSVVTVQVGTRGSDGFLPGGSGSGVIIDESGYIVTNDHVASSGQDIQVVLADGRVYEAELVGTDPMTDLAVLDIDATGLSPIRFGSTDALTVGDRAIAVGSPLGLEGGPSLTVGVVSAFGREVGTSPTSVLYGMLQTDAPITQGSSGGALVDENGRLIGITTAVGVSSVGIEGIGFATPVEIVERVTGELIATGEALLPFIGIVGTTGLEDTTDGGSQPTGVLIDSVEPDSGASAAGLEPGDLITALNGIEIDTMDELIALLRRYRVGDAVTLTVDRSQSSQIVELTLGARPS